MPFRLDDFRAKIQFITSSEMPNLIYEACVATGCQSNTRYIQEALCAAIARDLDLSLSELLSALPPTRGHAATLKMREHRRTGPGNTVEEVR